jgi:hypothetical protein
MGNYLVNLFRMRSGSVKNLESARVSMPAQVVKKTTDKGQEVYEWRTDLLATKPYWECKRIYYLIYRVV